MDPFAGSCSQCSLSVMSFVYFPLFKSILAKRYVRKMILITQSQCTHLPQHFQGSRVQRLPARCVFVMSLGLQSTTLFPDAAAEHPTSLYGWHFKKNCPQQMTLSLNGILEHRSYAFSNNHTLMAAATLLPVPKYKRKPQSSMLLVAIF